MPYKANEKRRHKIPRSRYRVENWAAYDAALRRRGDLTLCSKLTSIPRVARINSTCRRLKLKRWYSHTASLMIAAGKRKPRY